MGNPLAHGLGSAFGQRATWVDLLKALPATSDLIEDAFDAGSPDEGRGVGVPRREELGDGALKIAHTVEDAAANGLLAEFGKPTFDQVEPARTGWNEVQHEPGMMGQPALHARVAVRAVVVEDQMQGRATGELSVEPLEKLQELLMSVARITLADDPTFDDLEGGE